VKQYWHHLVPVTLFGPCAGLLWSRAHGAWVMPFIGVLFFAASFYAMWPTLTRRAKYSFWILACGLYVVGGASLAILVALVANAIFGLPAQ
jgi:hypothetical protein